MFKNFITFSVLCFAGWFLFKVAFPWAIDRIGFMAENLVVKIFEKKET